MDTKKHLASTLKKVMQTVPVDKITINQLTSAGNVARNTFYYHFDDINQLLEYIYADEIVTQLEAYKKQQNWLDGLKLLLDYIDDNRKFCLNTFRSVNRGLLEHFLYSVAFDMVTGVVMDLHPECDDKLRDEIGNFYGLALSSQLIQWLTSNMNESKDEFCERMNRMLCGSIDNVVEHNQE
ncbi:TetR/AcrR family transcriptional regulator [Companilactobacillus sp.]|uniref:TetR/AcrR family transcriptional regulator n=2 Tax=Companilactobacillus sp. TaxID=2767905 RepID=UPI0025BD9963|nr:TetR-like C-terminal domain-containing protein [Companilactobacillus sp.]MCH4009128.1 TetR/AcrR family transcriptional regulator C-terminal domain-containing protein [Companilactobacillus sp.]MCH4050693.1 TetR/AcrR family transcriptional regulator C-terminal domain-containing protein [Companilactobacillus sp.]MCH4077070.1 TetR/AcrR family transcriptional regulator C-terminal domain-containing protein [Companilactobacillus sp.]MCH4125646.1 TetR/AcrR family transcriptional regulator C-terminal